jgi:glycerophosphoryl diester phosphodiesterase
MSHLGFPAYVWTVNSRGLMQTLLGRAEVAALITDQPLEAIKVRDQLKPTPGEASEEPRALF